MLAETQFANLHIAAYRSGKYPERNYAPTQTVITKQLVQKQLHFIPYGDDIRSRHPIHDRVYNFVY